MIVKRIDDLALSCQISIIIYGRNRCEITPIEISIYDYFLRLIINGLLGFKRQRRLYVNSFYLFLKGQRHKRSRRIAFSYVITISDKRVFSIILAHLNDIVGRKCAFCNRYKLQSINVKFNCILCTPNTGIAVKTESNVEEILILLGLYVDIAVHRGIISAHFLRYRRCCG